MYLVRNCIICSMNALFCNLFILQIICMNDIPREGQVTVSVIFKLWKNSISEKIIHFLLQKFSRVV